MAVAASGDRRRPTAVKPEGALKFHSRTNPAAAEISTTAASDGSSDESAASVAKREASDKMLP